LFHKRPAGWGAHHLEQSSGDQRGRVLKERSRGAIFGAEDTQGGGTHPWSNDMWGEHRGEHTQGAPPHK